MRPALETASISIDKIVGDDDYRAYGKFCEGHGWDIDVMKNGKRVAMRNGAYAERDDGIDIVQETIDAVVAGLALSNTYFF